MRRSTSSCRSLLLALVALTLAAPAAAQVSSGLVGTSAPAWTNGQVAPFSLDPTGNLRVILTGGGGGGTSQADNSAVSGITGIGALYDTTPPVITDGNVGLPRMSVDRYLFSIFPVPQHIICDAGCGGASPFEDEDTFVPGTTSINVTGYVVDETTPDSAPENSAAAPRMAPNRIPYSILRDAAGNERGANVSASNQLSVFGPLTDTELRATPVPVSGTVAVSNYDGIVRDGAGDTTQANVSSGRLHTDGSGVTQPISAATLPLPTGAATSALQDGIVRDGAGDTTQANVSTGRLHVDGSGVTQPISGTVTANAGSGTFATDPTDDDARVLGRTKIHDGTDTALVSGAGSLQVTCDNCGGASPFEDLDAFTAGTSSVSVIGGVFNDGLADVTSGQAAAPRITKDRGLHANLRNDDGTEVGTAGAPLRMDPTGTTTQPISAASLPLPTGAATSALQDGIVRDGAGDTTQANVSTGRLHVDGSGVTQPVSGTVTVTLPNEGQQTMANSISVVVASDQSAVPVSLPNEGQQTAANSISVTPDTDNDAIGATAAAPPGEAVYVAGLQSGATGGLLGGITVCDDFANIDIVTAATTLIVTGVSGRHVRICSLSLVTAGANNVAFLSGTGATCGTGTTAMTGGTTAAEGYNFAANGGIAQGAGFGTINRTNATGDSVCIVTSAATQLSGRLGYAIH
jgi:hypothetical protein